jgi:hypothetical protein
MFDKQGLQEAIGFQVELELLDTYLSVFKVTNTGDSAPSNIRPYLPSDMASGRTSSCTDTATDGETSSLTGLSVSLTFLTSSLCRDFNYAIVQLMQKFITHPADPEACYILDVLPPSCRVVGCIEFR